MTPVLREWVTKAEGDFHSCEREIRVRRRPNHDSACFHAQQCVEKYLKARLQAADIAFPKTHDLEELLDLLLPLEPQWELLRPAVAQLTNYAVAFRYPGTTASKADARNAFAHAKLVRQIARQSLGLKK
jgi:HEPN domain-containing protein